MGSTRLIESRFDRAGLYQWYCLTSIVRLEQCFNKSMSKEDESESAEDLNGGFLGGRIFGGVSRICCSHYPMINGAVL